ncbi:MAG TPA: Nramp family divalent metal transporter [Solirubrobacterales bacterium]|jgi:NRAMP (natural resistance-associated macrophage protein)-like metal ion transporter|nr:Nramp family divalent metal transporter [Solirubrobacterales bacterium]
MPRHPAHRVPGRHTHWRVARRRRLLLRSGPVLALLAVVGPGILAGLSDDDPAGIATYSILGARYGYELLWVLAISTAALIVFHEVGVRLGVVTGKGLLTLVRERFGRRPAHLVLAALVIANTGTMCAEFAGVAAGMQLLGGISRYLSVPLAAVGVSALVLRESFRRVEHFLLLLSSVFVAYVVAGVLAHPDWGAAARGLVVPSIPLTRDAVLVAVATVGTTLAPWGLAFIQSYAVDKRLRVEDLRYERVDVIVGAVLTGVIGLFVVVACAATLHAEGIDVNDASDAARALEPLAGAAAATLFGLGFVGAALLAAAIVPLSTAYSISETLGRRADLDDSFAEARTFYLSFGAVVAVAAGLVLIPGAPLIQILFLSQALNAVLLLVLLPFIRSLAGDRQLMGPNALGRFDRWTTAIALAVVAVSVLALGVLAVA